MILSDSKTQDAFGPDISVNGSNVYVAYSARSLNLNRSDDAVLDSQMNDEPILQSFHRI